MDLQRLYDISYIKNTKTFIYGSDIQHAFATDLFQPIGRGPLRSQSRVRTRLLVVIIQHTKVSSRHVPNRRLEVRLLTMRRGITQHDLQRRVDGLLRLQLGLQVLLVLVHLWLDRLVRLLVVLVLVLGVDGLAVLVVLLHGRRSARVAEELLWLASWETVVTERLRCWLTRRQRLLDGVLVLRLLLCHYWLHVRARLRVEWKAAGIECDV
jgi:hypothetical protein